ncbi:MAG TPA: energy transducer TonB [Desulfomonilia bacterium]
MSYQSRAFQISFLLHAAIVVLVITCSLFLGQYKKSLVMDFDLLKPAPEVKKEKELEPIPLAKLIKPATPQIINKEEPPKKPEEAPRKSSIPETPPVVKLPGASNLETSPAGAEMPDQGKDVKEGSPGIAGGTPEGTGTNSSIGNGEDGMESARAKYLNEHFAYIRNKILNNVSYPDPAKRKGWQGKVLLSFVITADGSVRELKVLKSSGFALLDRSAIKTVRDTAPFPRPPGEAQLVIPITYHLE